jgi:hypothetical protein
MPLLIFKELENFYVIFGEFSREPDLDLLRFLELDLDLPNLPLSYVDILADFIGILISITISLYSSFSFIFGYFNKHNN